MDSPFVISIYDKGFRWLGNLADPVDVDMTVRFNAVSTGEITVRDGDPMLPFLYTKGARLRITYRGEHLMSGPVRHPTGDFGDEPTLIQVEDDWRVMQNTLGWVAPAGPLVTSSLDSGSPDAWAQAWLPGGFSDAGPAGTTTGQYGYFLWPDGSAAVGGVVINDSESAIKHLITVNALNRLGRPLTIEASLGRGGDARAAGMLPLVRFSPLDECLEALLAWSGLGLRFWHDGVTATVRVGVFGPTVWAQPLSIESGSIESGHWSREYPNVTRVVLGGPGEDVQRAFAQQISGDLETEYGDIIEVFRDATGANLLWPDALADLYRVAKYYLLRPEVSAAAKAFFSSYLAAEATKALAAGLPTSGLSLTLSETETFFYGPGGYHVGDIISATSDGVTFTDRILECQLRMSPSTGLTVQPIVGVRRDDPDELLARAIAQLQAAQRYITTSK